MIPTLRRALVNHVLRQFSLAEYAGEQLDITEFLNLLPQGSSNSPNIFDVLSGSQGVSNPAAQETLTGLRNANFEQAAQRLSLKALPDPASHFDAWAAIIEAEAHHIAGTRGERGLSLATEFKLLSAIAHAAGGNVENLVHGFQLISGDFPGVQRVIYTIASDGATKGVRGRSFFLQLLGECIVRRILSELQLPLTNLLYMAGGRFLILAPAQTELLALGESINASLLEWFDGDLYLALSTTPLSIEALKDAHLLRQAQLRLFEDERQQKTQPFVSMLSNAFFAAYGVGSEFFCAISRREPRTPGEVEDARQARAENRPWISPEQQAFRFLAEDLAIAETGYIVFSADPVHRNVRRREDPLYPSLLYAITGWCAVLFRDKDEALNAIGATSSYALVRLNKTDFDVHTMHGYRFLAAHTPHIKPEDLDWLAKHPDDEETHYEAGRTIRSFDLLATRGDASNGFARLGVLRMDVDSLGKVFEQRLQVATLTRQMELSHALSEFFEAYLPQICRTIEDEQVRPDSLYLLYGGGDDLFIVGEWDLMPRLAQRIHDLLLEYSQGKLTISAGIELIPLKFPFYVAAEWAKSALDDRAKEYRRDDEARPSKNAVSLFGEVFDWSESGDWHELNDLQQRLLSVHRADQKQTAIRNVARVYDRWRQDYEKYGDRYLKFGPFCWMAAYQFTRILDGIKQGDNTQYIQLRNSVKVIQDAILQNIQLGGTAARWAEFELRSGVVAEAATDKE